MRVQANITIHRLQDARPGSHNACWLLVGTPYDDKLLRSDLLNLDTCSFPFQVSVPLLRPQLSKLQQDQQQQQQQLPRLVAALLSPRAIGADVIETMAVAATTAAQAKPSAAMYSAQDASAPEGTAQQHHEQGTHSRQTVSQHAAAAAKAQQQAVKHAPDQRLPVQPQQQPQAPAAASKHVTAAAEAQQQAIGTHAAEQRQPVQPQQLPPRSLAEVAAIATQPSHDGKAIAQAAQAAHTGEVSCQPCQARDTSMAPPSARAAPLPGQSSTIAPAGSDASGSVSTKKAGHSAAAPAAASNAGTVPKWSEVLKQRAAKLRAQSESRATLAGGRADIVQCKHADALKAHASSAAQDSARPVADPVQQAADASHQQVTSHPAPEGPASNVQADVPQRSAAQTHNAAHPPGSAEGGQGLCSSAVASKLSLRDMLKQARSILSQPATAPPAHNCSSGADTQQAAVSHHCAGARGAEGCKSGAVTQVTSQRPSMQPASTIVAPAHVSSRTQRAAQGSLSQAPDRAASVQQWLSTQELEPSALQPAAAAHCQAQDCSREPGVPASLAEPVVDWDTFTAQPARNETASAAPHSSVQASPWSGDNAGRQHMPVPSQQTARPAGQLDARLTGTQSNAKQMYAHAAAPHNTGATRTALRQALIDRSNHGEQRCDKITIFTPKQTTPLLQAAPEGYKSSANQDSTSPCMAAAQRPPDTAVTSLQNAPAAQGCCNSTQAPTKKSGDHAAPAAPADVCTPDVQEHGQRASCAEDNIASAEHVQTQQAMPGAELPCGTQHPKQDQDSMHSRSGAKSGLAAAGHSTTDAPVAAHDHAASTHTASPKQPAEACADPGKQKVGKHLQALLALSRARSAAVQPAAQAQAPGLPARDLPADDAVGPVNSGAGNRACAGQGSPDEHNNHEHAFGDKHDSALAAQPAALADQATSQHADKQGSIARAPSTQAPPPVRCQTGNLSALVTSEAAAPAGKQPALRRPPLLKRKHAEEPCDADACAQSDQSSAPLQTVTEASKQKPVVASTHAVGKQVQNVGCAEPAAPASAAQTCGAAGAKGTADQDEALMPVVKKARQVAAGTAGARRAFHVPRTNPARS